MLEMKYIGYSGRMYLTYSGVVSANLNIINVDIYLNYSTKLIRRLTAFNQEVLLVPMSITVAEYVTC